MEDEQEWIESPQGWASTSNTNTENDTTDDKNDDDDDNDDDDNDDDEQDDRTAILDLFTDQNPHTTFSFPIISAGNNGKIIETLRLSGFKLDSNETAQSTGVTLWQAAPRLATFLVQSQQSQQQSSSSLSLRGHRVLELGAGLGLCGIVAHVLGASNVLLTDGDTQTLQQLRTNVQQNITQTNNIHNNDTTIQCRQLIWGSPYVESFRDLYGRFDIILGADVIYNQDSMGPLFDTVVHLLDIQKTPYGKFILSRYNAWNDVSNEMIFEMARARNLHCIERPSEGIFIFCQQQ